MAIYEYDCKKCGARIELLQPMGSRPQAECGEDCVADPATGDGPLVRVLSVANVGSSRPDPTPPMPSCGNCTQFDPDRCG